MSVVFPVLRVPPVHAVAPGLFSGVTPDSSCTFPIALTSSSSFRCASFLLLSASAALLLLSSITFSYQGRSTGVVSGAHDKAAHSCD